MSSNSLEQNYSEKSCFKYTIKCVIKAGSACAVVSFFKDAKHIIKYIFASNEIKPKTPHAA